MKRIATLKSLPSPNSGAKRVKNVKSPTLTEHAKKQLRRIEDARADTAGKAALVRIG